MRIEASEIEKVFMLKSVRPFEKLDERMLFNIAEVMRLSKFEPNVEILTENEVSNEVIISLDSNIFDKQGHSITIAGIYSVLNDSPIESGIRAGKNGSRCLRIGKGHFLTTIYECPNLLTELIILRNNHPHYYL